MTTSEPHLSPPPPRPSASPRRFLLMCACALVAVGVVWLVFTLAGQADTAAGAVVGGGVVVVLAVVVRWRALRVGPSGVGSAGRALLGATDERDNVILSASLAWVGVAAFVANAVGLVAVALGADGSTVIGAIEVALIGVLVAAFVVLSRRL
jgi:hypothetical protein